MVFDAAVAAQTAFKKAQQTGKLGDDLDRAIEAEESFSTEVGETASAAYQLLLQIGERHPEATAFQEFLIYLTWQQVVAEPIPVYFQKGLELCDRYLNQGGSENDRVQVIQIRELRTSFLNGLGQGCDENDHDDEDAVIGED